MIDYKALDIVNLKVLDTALGIVEAIVSVFGIVDAGFDVIHPGAFSKTIAERGLKVKVLDLHNTDSVNRIVGKVLEIRELGRDELPAELLVKYPSATGGLYTKVQYLMDTPEGLGTYARISSGALTEYSIGFQALDYDFSDSVDGRPIRHLRTIKLWEISPVIWGMNGATVTTGVKNGDVPADVADPTPVDPPGVPKQESQPTFSSTETAGPIDTPTETDLKKAELITLAEALGQLIETLKSLP